MLLRILLLVCLVVVVHSAEAVEVTLSISDVSVEPGARQVAIPILMENEDAPVRAVQLVMAFDPDLIGIVDFQKTGRADNMDVVTYNVPFPGDLRAVVLDLGTDLIPQGSGGIATLFIDVFDSAPSTSTALIFVTEDGPDGHTTLVFGEDVQEFPLRVKHGVLYVGSALAVDEAASGDAESLVDVVAQNVPNPFNADTEIRYWVGRPEYVALNVYDTSGQMIRSLVDAWQDAGAYRVQWDGRDDRGIPVASGVYLYRLGRPDLHTIKRMVVLR